MGPNLPLTCFSFAQVATLRYSFSAFPEKYVRGFSSYIAYKQYNITSLAEVMMLFILKLTHFGLEL